LTLPCAFMSVFLMLALVPDVGLRGHWVSEERELYMAEPRGTGRISAAQGESAPSEEQEKAPHGASH
jgi:hypothetical protein